ncbi:MAG: SH3 domain-containing protein [Spirochaetia bacterium]|nr:SH3 domain-containing protein [Spirochaetia bacterium]
MINKGGARATLTIVLILFLFSSCGALSRIGYGVVLWGGTSLSLKPGTLVEIHQQNSFDHTYNISTLQDDVQYTVKKGIIAKFKSRKKAREFIKTYTPYLDSFALVMVNGLRVRDKAGIKGDSVYRLRKGSEVKVVNKIKIDDTSEPFKGIWYRVVTSDGYEGYSYGKYLRLRSEQEELSSVASSSLYTQLKENLFSGPWRPEYMQEMIRQHSIDLERFDPQIGLFPNEEKQQIKITTSKSSLIFSTEESNTLPPNKLSFSSGDLVVAVLDEDELRVEYEYRGTLFREKYVKLDRSVEETIEQEKERREKRYAQFLSYGKEYRSSYYGKLMFDENFVIKWTGRARVPSSVVPAGSKKNGQVNFNIFLSGQLKKDYTGAFSMMFPYADRTHEVSFLYRRENHGLQLTYIPDELITRNKVAAAPASSTFIMFFTHQEKMTQM